MNIQRNNLLFLLAAFICSPLVNLHPAAEGRTLNSVNTSATVSPDNNPNNHPQIKNIVFPGQKKIFLNTETIFWPPAIPLDLNQECPISKFSFLEHFEMLPTLIVAAVETEAGNIRIYNGFAISSWLLNDTFSAPRRNLIDLLDQSPITKISYFLLSSLEEDFQFLCTLDDLTANENDIQHRYYRDLLRATGNDADAQCSLGTLYVHCWQELNLGSQEDGIQKALPYFQAATEQSLEAARYNLVSLYETHWQTLDICSQKEAIEQICQIDLAAANQGSLGAQSHLGSIYINYWQILDLTKQEGMEQALIYYLLAAQNNHAVSFCNQSTIQLAQLNVIYLSEHVTGQHQNWFDNVDGYVLERYAANHPARFEAIETKIRNFNENQAEQN